MKNKSIKEYKLFQERNINRIVRYRLRSFFNLKNNEFDRFFAKNKFRKSIFSLLLKIYCTVNFFLQKKVSIPQIDFLITTNCTLNCKNCATLIPYYSSDKRYNLSFEQFKSDLDKLLSVVDKIYRLKLIGGEPLIINELNEMLEYACNQRQIVSVEITTNGTILPSDEICNTLKKHNKKALVVLSDYSHNKDLANIKFEEIKNKLEKYDIYTIISKYDWFEIGKIKQLNQSEDELRQTFKDCWQKDCIAIANGIIHNCTRSAAIARLTSFNIPETDIVNIRNGETHSLMKKFNKFYVKDYYSSCDFCISVLHNRAEIAQQLKIPANKINDFRIEYDI